MKPKHFYFPALPKLFHGPARSLRARLFGCWLTRILLLFTNFFHKSAKRIDQDLQFDRLIKVHSLDQSMNSRWIEPFIIGSSDTVITIVVVIAVVIVVALLSLSNVWRKARRIHKTCFRSAHFYAHWFKSVFIDNDPVIKALNGPALWRKTASLKKRRDTMWYDVIQCDTMLYIR